MKKKSQPWPPVAVRLVAEGTRVKVLTGPTPRLNGIITELRTQTNLKSYVVTLDDGSVMYASGYDLALEDDVERAPLTVRPPD